MSEIRFRQAFLILLVGAISIAFVAMIRTFLLTILMAAIFSGVAYPVYRRLRYLLGGHQALASITTIVLLLALVMVPLGAVMGAIANQALRVSDTVRPRLQRMVNQPGEIETGLRALPGFKFIEPYREQIITKVGELLGSTGALLVNAISATTVATAVFFFQFVVMLYTMFFFLIGGPGLLRSVLAYLPLTEGDKERMIERFVSVTRATLKGSVLIGTAQGMLSGLAFWAVGIDGALFWGAMMAVLSIIPGIGGRTRVGAGGGDPRRNRRGVARGRPRCLLRTDRRQRGQRAAADPGRPRHADARADDFLLDAGRPALLRRDGLHRRSDSGRALRDRVGDVRIGVQKRARDARGRAGPLPSARRRRGDHWGLGPWGWGLAGRCT